MALKPAEKKEIITKYGASASDTGSPESQVALLSRRIEEVTEHLQTNQHDHHNRRGLLLLVGRRRRILQYLAKTDIARYRAIIDKLGIRRQFAEQLNNQPSASLEVWSSVVAYGFKQECRWLRSKIHSL